MSGLSYFNKGPFTGIAGEALEPYRLVKLSSGTWIYTDAAEVPEAITGPLPVASGAFVSLWPLSKGGVVRVTGLSSEAAGTAIYPAADGKVADTAGGGKAIGQLLLAISAAGGIAPAILYPDIQNTISAPMMTGKFFDDFLVGNLESGNWFSETDNKTKYLKTSVDGSAGGVDVCAILDDARGGILQLTCNAANADAEGLQLVGESFKLAVGKRLYFEAKFALLDVDKCDFFIGLCISDTTVLAGATDRVGFQNLHTAALRALTEQDTTEYIANTGITLLDCANLASFYTKANVVSFYWDGVDTITYAVDGVASNAFTDNATTILVPDDETLTPTMEIMTHTGAAAVQTVWLDYWLCFFER